MKKSLLLLLFLLGILIICVFYIKPTIAKRFKYEWNVFFVEELSVKIKSYESFLSERQKLNEIPFSALPYTGDKAKYKCELRFNSKKSKAKVKIPGMYNDHWKHDKFSMKISKAKSFGNKKFGVLNPVTRDYLGSWLVSKLEQYSNINSLERKYIKVTVNKKNKGIYLYEEGFSDSFFSSRNLETGVIFKTFLSDSSNLLRLSLKNNYKNKSYMELKISEFLKGEKSVNDLFNIYTLAKYYAITDLVQGSHQLLDFNTHWVFYNETNKITPIGREWNSFNSIGKEKELCIDYIDENQHNTLHSIIFRDSLFLNVYKKELQNILEFDLDCFFETINDDLEYNKSLLWFDLGENGFDYSYLYENQKYISKRLKEDVLK